MRVSEQLREWLKQLATMAMLDARTEPEKQRAKELHVALATALPITIHQASTTDAAVNAAIAAVPLRLELQTIRKRSHVALLWDGAELVGSLQWPNPRLQRDQECAGAYERRYIDYAFSMACAVPLRELLTVLLGQHWGAESVLTQRAREILAQARMP